MGLLDKVTELFLVTTTSVPALYEAKRAIAALRSAGFESDRLRLVINQLAATQDFSGSNLDRIFGIPVYAKFSAASRELHDACLQGKLPAENIYFHLQMASLARKTAGLQKLEPRRTIREGKQVQNMDLDGEGETVWASTPGIGS